MTGISELARLYGMSEYDLKRRLYNSIGINEFNNVQNLDSRQIRARLDNILDKNQLTSLGFGNQQATSIREDIGQNLNLVA